MVKRLASRCGRPYFLAKDRAEEHQHISPECTALREATRRQKGDLPILSSACLLLESDHNPDSPLLYLMCA
jgi:hypothetical protein